MKTSKYHGLKKPEIIDDVLETIVGLEENFGKLDSLIPVESDELNYALTTGGFYPIAFKVWNTSPVVGEGVGWINLREGFFAPTWQENTQYNVDDLIIPSVNNGHIYRCTANGTSQMVKPTLATSTGMSSFDLGGVNTWSNNKVYQSGDVVIDSQGNEEYHYRCTSGGTSGLTEPTWNATVGGQTVDNSVTWQTYKTVKWTEAGVSCNFKDFGTINE